MGLTEELDRLMATLDAALKKWAAPEAADGGLERDSMPPHRGAGRGADAIDAEFAAERRVTRVLSLRDSPEAEAFRQSLVDGLIRVDTANQLLRLVNTVVTRLLV